tara:strand:- start:126 stop:944 length:819 start_codon:yes stop_codon:yes gene_type:complete
MEPQIIDHYNELPNGIHVIDKMNEELEEAQKEIETLKKNQRTESEKKFKNKFQMPRIKVASFEEYNKKQDKLKEFTEYIRNIIYEGAPEQEAHEERITSLFEDYFNYDNNNYISSFHNIYLEATGGGSNTTRNHGILSVLINKLDDLTDNINKAWCENRILTSIEVYNLKDHIATRGLEYSLADTIVGYGDMGGGPGWDLPTVYVELSLMNTFKTDELLDGEPCLYNIWYYDCEECGKSSTHAAGEPDNVDNKLLCGDCHFSIYYGMSPTNY